jgi:predicted dehydrogenase
MAAKKSKSKKNKTKPSKSDKALDKQNKAAKKTEKGKKAKKGAAPAKAGNPALDAGLLANKRIKDPVRVGIVGLGRIGWDHHAQAVAQHNGFELAAACDLMPTRVREVVDATGCSGYADLAEMLADDAVELVIVCTQTVDHERMAIQALKAGKHVLCEKPAVRTPQGVDRMISAAKANDKLVTIHHNYRRNPEFLVAREIIASGVIGKVFRIKRRVANFARRNDWQVLLKYGGGMLGNWGVHLVDQGLQLAGSEPGRVWGAVGHHFNPGDAEDDIKAVFECKNGVVVDIDMTCVDASPGPSWVIQGTHGTFWIMGSTATVKYFEPKALPKIRTVDKTHALNRAYGVRPGPEKIDWIVDEFPVRPKGSYDSFYDNLYEAIRKGAELQVTPESARTTYDVLARIRRGSGF